MKEKELKIDTSCHVVYSKPCKEAILKRISQHYEPSQVDSVFEAIQHQYEAYLDEFSHKDLGGKKNFHNGVGGTYDCIMIVCYYVVCKDKTSFEEVQQIAEDVLKCSMKEMKFINIDKPFWKHLMYLAFTKAGKRCQKWHDYEMIVDPYSKEQPLHYCFHTCPFADFIHQFHLEEIAPALCNVDYAAMKGMNTVLVRKHTLIESDQCDYTFYGPKDERLKEHPQYIDEQGFIRNK